MASTPDDGGLQNEPVIEEASGATINSMDGGASTSISHRSRCKAYCDRVVGLASAFLTSPQFFGVLSDPQPLKHFLGRIPGTPSARVEIVDWMVGSSEPRRYLVDIRPDVDPRSPLPDPPEASGSNPKPISDPYCTNLRNLLDVRNNGVENRLIVATDLNFLVVGTLGQSLDLDPGFVYSHLVDVADYTLATSALKPYFTSHWFRPVSLTRKQWDAIANPERIRKLSRHSLYFVREYFRLPGGFLDAVVEETVSVCHIPSTDNRPNTVLVLTDPIPSIEAVVETGQMDQERVVDGRPFRSGQVKTSGHEDRSSAAILCSDLLGKTTGQAPLLRRVVDSALKIFVSDTAVLQSRLNDGLESLREFYLLNRHLLEEDLLFCDIMLSDMCRQLNEIHTTATTFMMADSVLACLHPSPSPTTSSGPSSSFHSCGTDFFCSQAARHHVFSTRPFAKLYIRENLDSPIRFCAQHIVSRVAEQLALTSDVSSSLRGSLSIFASRKAIEETRSVTKLTELAFFFIPLAFTTSIFGMEFNELQGLSIRVWLFVVAAMMPCVYLVRLTLNSSMARRAARKYTVRVRHHMHISPGDDPVIHDYFLTLFSFVPPHFVVLFFASLVLVVLAWTVLKISRQAKVAMTVLSVVVVVVYFPTVYWFGRFWLGPKHRYAPIKVSGLMAAFLVVGVTVSATLWLRVDVASDAKAVWSAAAWWPFLFALVLFWHSVSLWPLHASSSRFIPSWIDVQAA